MEPTIKRFIALVLLNIVLLAVCISKCTTDSSSVGEQRTVRRVDNILQSTNIEEVETYIKNHRLDPDISLVEAHLTYLKTQKTMADLESFKNNPPVTEAVIDYSKSSSASSGKPKTNSNNKTQSSPVQETRRTLTNGSQPYSQWYGYNQRYSSEKPQSTIQVTSAVAQDVIVIVKYNNKDGKVAGHLYIQAGRTGKIYVTPGYRYQVFFYYGDDWDENKQMPGGVRGGFTRHEQADKDPNSHYFAIDETYDGITWDGGMEYNLNPTYNGNFNTKKSSVSEVF